jgi:putative membrane protein
MHKILVMLIVGASTVWSGAVWAATQPPGSRQTRDFVQSAAQSDAFEVLEAQTVLATTRDPDIRAFAQHMIHDHRETTRALEQAAVQSGLEPPPPGISSDEAALLGALQSLRGHEFDVAYLRQQVVAHSGALVVERLYAQSGDDPAVRQAAAAATPLIASHLAMVEQLRAKLAGS